MEGLYILIVGLLFCLAIFDLVVGVSNDAVNFLNSAIGSNAAKWKTIMIIASIGIMLGAVSSGGMMEVARKGIFNPQHFYFKEIMVLFMAVMITDIILLDLFNTFAMPTSTTVSIVFEILGASLALSVIKVIHGELPMTYLFNKDDPAAGIVGFMNWSKAGEIISGILLSVIVAFTIGAIVQFLARFMFSFRYHKRMRIIGSIFSGLAFTSITYFLLFKGMKGIIKGVAVEDMNSIQLMFNSFFDILKHNLIAFMGICFAFFTVLMYVLQNFKVNPLRLVVLFGTFSLAMAFAGNDLVNFIGVPIAGFQSYNLWVDAGSPSAETFSMIGLAGKVHTPYVLLVLAGVIMTITLWTSKKARSVTETEVNLGAQSEVEERFAANGFARAIVNGTSFLNKQITLTVPKNWLNKISSRFAPIEDDNSAHFDLVRASVNLLTASILIAIATNMKLPLSTTYVSFMVAMGTSLADRAWGRESAVYRVSGVMSVVGGWFLTAIIATTVAAIFAAIMFYFGLYGIAALVLLVAFTIYKSSRHHKKTLEKKELSASKSNVNYKDVQETLDYLTHNVDTSLGEIKRTLELTHLGIAREDKKALAEANKHLKHLNADYAMVKNGLFKIIKTNKSSEPTSSHLYVLTYDLMQDILQSLSLIVNVATTHVHNNHKPLVSEQCDNIEIMKALLSEYLSDIRKCVSEQDFNKAQLDNIINKKSEFLAKINAYTQEHIGGVMERKYGFKNTSLYFTLLLEMKDLVAVAARFVKLYARAMDKKTDK